MGLLLRTSPVLSGVLAVAIGLVAACAASPEAPAAGQPSAASTMTSAPTPSVTAVPTRAPTSASTPIVRGTPTVVNPPSAAGGSAVVTCRLPVQTSFPQPVGWLDTATGRFEPDRTASFHKGGAFSDLVISDQQPVLRGHASDAASPAERLAWSGARWVPVSPDLLAPDRSRYAWTEQVASMGAGTPNRLHVTVIASGDDRVIVDGDTLRPIGWTSAGIVAVRRSATSPTPVGLYLVDPDTGNLRELAHDGWWMAIHDGGAFGIATDPGVLLRMDLATGARNPWFTAFPGEQVRAIGSGGSGVVIEVAASRILVTRTDAATLISGNLDTQFLVPDRTRSWIARGAPGNGLFVLTGSSVQKIQAPAEVFSVAGGCAA